MLDIYYWRTDNGRKALMMIEETGLPHRLKPIDIGKREQFAPEFMAISPGHKIPALVDDEGPGGARVALSESGAILKYLAEKAGGGLYPAEPMKRLKVDQWFFYGTSTFTPWAQQYGLFMHRFAHDVPPVKTHYGDLMRDMFGVLDRHLAQSEYMADQFSIADIACYPDLDIHGNQGIGLGDWPNLKRWRDLVAARPATQRAWAI